MVKIVPPRYGIPEGTVRRGNFFLTTCNATAFQVVSDKSQSPLIVLIAYFQNNDTSGHTTTRNSSISGARTYCSI